MKKEELKEYIQGKKVWNAFGSDEVSVVFYADPKISNDQRREQTRGLIKFLYTAMFTKSK